MAENKNNRMSGCQPVPGDFSVYKLVDGLSGRPEIQFT